MSEESRPARILHVDDDTEVLQEAKRYLEGEEIPGWGRPEVVSIPTFDGAIGALEKERFDLVVLDVRLGSEQEEVDIENEAGFLALEEIRSRRFVPVVFWTALPGAISHLSSELVLVREKTELVPALAAAINSLFATRLPSVNRALIRLVEDEQRRYMWDFVVDHWDELRAVHDHTAVAYLLARRLGRSLSGPGIQRLAKALGEEVSGFPPDDKIHPMEMYLQPPMSETGIQAGDILREDDGGNEAWWVVLTPSCDIEHGKAEFLQLAACLPFDDQGDVTTWRAGEGNKQERKKAKARVLQLLNQQTGGQHDRWLFLPQALDVPSLIVDLQSLRSISIEAVADLRRVASLESPFAEAAINRFNRYYGRIGTPDLDADGVLMRLEEASGD